MTLRLLRDQQATKAGSDQTVVPMILEGKTQDSKLKTLYVILIENPE